MPTLSCPRPVQPTPPPVKPSSCPNPSSPCQAIKLPNPLLPLSSCRAVQHPPPCQVPPFFCLLLHWLATTARLSFIWLVVKLPGGLSPPLITPLPLFFRLVAASTNQICPLHVFFRPSSRQAFAVKPLPLGHPANLGVELSNHWFVQTPLPLIKPLIRPTPSSPRQPVNPSNPFSSCPA